MCGCAGAGCSSCRRRWTPGPLMFGPSPTSEVERLKRELRDLEIERNALRLALRLTLEKVTD